MDETSIEERDPSPKFSQWSAEKEENAFFFFLVNEKEEMLIKIKRKFREAHKLMKWNRTK